jgi:regulator of protease activity HflC (stomatin/prohibitin superfamily)
MSLTNQDPKAQARVGLPADPTAAEPQPGSQLRGNRPLHTERKARAVSGWAVLIVGLVASIASVFAFVRAAIEANRSGSFPAYGIVSVVLFLLALFFLAGLTPVAPGEARVLQLLGRYTGTVREDGLKWVNPLTTRTKISTRIRNHETATSKVNDAAGNPIEIAAVVVWQVTDTAMARFSVDDFVEFVLVQTESAVRHIANSYPYDNNTGTAGLSLRDNADEITAELSHEVAARVAPAGVEIIESRLTRLAYAPEIAQSMLRRQQADAVVAARARIVDGAVGMVQQALDRLEEDAIVTLDDERKATMVSNLLVVLCSEQSTQPVVNTGTLYS